MFPSNESETIELFKLCTPHLGWSIISLQTAFPDAVIGNGNGGQLVVEFEYRAKNFKAHKHDPGGCDLIICYENDWPKAPIPVWEIRDQTAQYVKKINSLAANQITKVRNDAQAKAVELQSTVNHWKSKYETLHWDVYNDDVYYEEEEKKTIASVMIPSGLLVTAFLFVALMIEFSKSATDPPQETIYSGIPLLPILFVLTCVYWTIWETLNQIIKLKEERNEQA